jgi:non-heme chloroperoxidase
MLKTDANPGGLPIEVFDDLRVGTGYNRAQFYLDVASGPFYGFNRDGATVSDGIVRNWWRQGMMGGVKAHYEGIKAFSETDFTDDLKKFDKPTLIVHGDDDQIVPIDAAGRASKRLVPHADLKVYADAPHGLGDTHKEQLCQDMLTFLRAEA